MLFIRGWYCGSVGGASTITILFSFSTCVPEAFAHINFTFFFFFWFFLDVVRVPRVGRVILFTYFFVSFFLWKKNAKKKKINKIRNRRHHQLLPKPLSQNSALRTKAPTKTKDWQTLFVQKSVFGIWPFLGVKLDRSGSIFLRSFCLDSFAIQANPTFLCFHFLRSSPSGFTLR